MCDTHDGEGGRSARVLVGGGVGVGINALRGRLSWSYHGEDQHARTPLDQAESCRVALTKRLMAAGFWMDGPTSALQADTWLVIDVPAARNLLYGGGEQSVLAVKIRLAVVNQEIEGRPLRGALGIGHDGAASQGKMVVA